MTTSSQKTAEFTEATNCIVRYRSNIQKHPSRG